MEADGWEIQWQCGSHVQFKKPGQGRITVPDHGNRDLSLDVLKDAERRSGLELIPRPHKKKNKR
ncbi:MAG: type II toxin-antitoxin system HicA family toxin [Thermoguttaceae bacterium]|nr:type II toxin-antitoxin system HicA family toxin [Thermoguttaceae bacterium]